MYIINKIYTPPIIRLFIASSRELNIADWTEHVVHEEPPPDCHPSHDLPDYIPDDPSATPAPDEPSVVPDNPPAATPAQNDDDCDPIINDCAPNPAGCSPDDLPCNPENPCYPIDPPCDPVSEDNNESGEDNKNLIKDHIKDPDIANDDKPQLTQGSLLRQEEFGGLLFNKDGCKVYQLNDTAFYFLNSILAHGVKATLTECVDIYDAPVDLLQNDIYKMLACVTKLGLLA